MSSPGAEFQDEIRRSIPKKAGSREIWTHKPPDVPMFGLRCRKCQKGFLKRRCDVCRAEDNFDPRFTPKHPFDLVVSIPCKGTGDMRGSVVPQIVFAFELKRTQGKIPARGPAELHGLLGFKDVKDHQVSGLKKVAAAGNVAGVLWLVELVDEGAVATLRHMKGKAYVPPYSQIATIDAACHFIPIDRWEVYKANAKGASMPLKAARLHGLEVEQDADRPRAKKRYWKMPELFIHYGADVEPTPERKKKRPRPPPKPALRLFDEPPREEEKVPF